jgi:hypothetical protein
VQIERRFDDLLKHGYIDARRDFDGQWRLRVRSRRAYSRRRGFGAVTCSRFGPVAVPVGNLRSEILAVSCFDGLN